VADGDENEFKLEIFIVVGELFVDEFDDEEEDEVEEDEDEEHNKLVVLFSIIGSLVTFLFNSTIF
jgi:hypothetical protein